MRISDVLRIRVQIEELHRKQIGEYHRKTVSFQNVDIDVKYQVQNVPEIWRQTFWRNILSVKHREEEEKKSYRFVPWFYNFFFYTQHTSI